MWPWFQFAIRYLRRCPKSGRTGQRCVRGVGGAVLRVGGSHALASLARPAAGARPSPAMPAALWRRHRRATQSTARPKAPRQTATTGASRAMELAWDAINARSACESRHQHAHGKRCDHCAQWVLANGGAHAPGPFFAGVQCLNGTFTDHLLGRRDALPMAKSWGWICSGSFTGCGRHAQRAVPRRNTLTTASKMMAPISDTASAPRLKAS